MRQNGPETDNVVSFPIARVKRPRVVDTDAADFLFKVHNIMFQETGLKYMPIRETLHGKDKEMLRTAIDQGNTPEQFVEYTINSYGLHKHQPGISQETTSEYNRARVAMVEFADEMRFEGWQRGVAGSVYKEILNSHGEITSVALMQPLVHQKTGEVGFGIAVYDCDEHSIVDGATIAFNQTPVAKFQGFDIEDVYERLQRYENEIDYKASGFAI